MKKTTTVIEAKVDDIINLHSYLWEVNTTSPLNIVYLRTMLGMFRPIVNNMLF